MTPLAIPDPETVDRHGFDFRPRWWSGRITEQSWTAALDTLPEATRKRGYRHITRADLFDPRLTGPAVLVAAYAWGTGPSAFLVPRRTRVFRDTPAAGIAEPLARAAELLATGGAEQAYASLVRGGANRIKHLGPSFFTKVLYALDHRAGQPGRALILDQFVAIALNHRAGWSLNTGGPWTTAEYARWLDHAHAEAAARPAPVRADAVEMAMFTYGRNLARERRQRRSS